MTDKYKKFGVKCSRLLFVAPMGSLSKRELELKLLQAAIEAGLAAPNGVEFAAKFRLTLARANSYLTDLALRKPALNDLESVTA